jgi:hypothetical protein
MARYYLPIIYLDHMHDTFIYHYHSLTNSLMLAEPYNCWIISAGIQHGHYDRRLLFWDLSVEEVAFAEGVWDKEGGRTSIR